MKIIQKLTILTFLLSAFCFNASAQTSQKDDDFEIVVPGQKDAKTSQIAVSAPSPQPAPTETPSKNNAGNNANAAVVPAITKRGKNGKKIGDITAANLGATGSLPLRVEVSDLQPNAMITLGVGAATRFQSQEKPTRLVIGNLTDIGVTKAGSSSWYGFYLRPVNGGITTNMFIEFASGATVMINLKTVDPKVLRPGDYNSEVFVKTATMRDEMIKMRAENENLKNKVGNLEKSLKEKKPEEVGPAKVFTADEMDNGVWKVLEKSSGLIKGNTGFPKNTAIGKINIDVLTPVWEAQKNQNYLWLEINNKEKKAVSITKIELVGAKGEVVSSKSGLIVEPNKQSEFGVRISFSEPSAMIPVLRLTTSDGRTGDIALPTLAASGK